MQAQVVHQRKQNLPWIPMIVAALVVAATALGVQSATRDRGTTVGPPVASIDQGANLQQTQITDAGVRSIGGHGPARITTGEDPKVSSQKAGMVEGGITSVGGGAVGSAGSEPEPDALARIEQAR
jgi:negative regulator of sigma E activity